MSRARDWHHAGQAAVCDVVEPWAHGTVLRATRYPDYWDFNVVRVERDPGMSADALAAFADDALAGLAHRRVDFELAEVAAPLRPGFEALGWRIHRLVWMRHEAEPPPASGVAVETVPYEAVRALRVAWHQEDFPGHDPGRGIGTALTRAAIDAAGAVRDLWIVADDEDRPKDLYARLGFRPAWVAVEALRLP